MTFSHAELIKAVEAHLAYAEAAGRIHGEFARSA